MKKYLLRDDDEGFYNAILFKEDIEIEKLEEFIKNYKKDNERKWNIDNIARAIVDNFKVKENIMFDYLTGTTGNIVGDSFLE